MRLLLFILFLTATSIAKAQKIDTVYGGCAIKKVDKNNIGSSSNTFSDAGCPGVPGGDKALFNFYHKRLKWRKTNSKAKSRIFVDFIVEKDGSLSHIEIVRGLNPVLDAEALRVTKLLPHWTPAKLDGKPVRVRYTIPVLFRHTRY